MQEGLTIQGDLEDLPVPEILRSLLRSEGLSSCTITRSDYNYRIFVKDGSIVYTSCDDPDFYISTLLFQKGEIDLQGLQNVREAMTSGQTDGRQLVQLEVISPDELIAAVDLQVRTILEEIINWRSGKYVMVFDDTFPSDGIMVKLDTDRMILELMRTISWWSLINKGLGGFRKVYRRTPNMDAIFYRLDLSDDESHIYNLIEAPHRVEEICQMSYLNDFGTLRTLWALKCVNLVEETMTAKVEEKKDHSDEYFLSSLVESYNDAFFKFFTVFHEELGDEVYGLIDEIYEDLDEQVKSGLEGCNLHNEGRLDFDILYNNFVASKAPSLPQAFQDVLNEVLYGWVFKIRHRFGDAHNEMLDQAINSIHEE